MEVAGALDWSKKYGIRPTELSTHFDYDMERISFHYVVPKGLKGARIAAEFRKEVLSGLRLGVFRGLPAMQRMNWENARRKVMAGAAPVHGMIVEGPSQAVAGATKDPAVARADVLKLP